MTISFCKMLLMGQKKKYTPETFSVCNSYKLLFPLTYTIAIFALLCEHYVQPYKNTVTVEIQRTQKKQKPDLLYGHSCANLEMSAHNGRYF